MRTGSDAGIDTLNDWRDVLYAYTAYRNGLRAAFDTYWSSDAEQKDRDVKIMDKTITGYLLSSGDPLSLASAIVNGTTNPTLNHARNTAVQRLHDGTVRLTPLYDFAPMFLDPEIVPRSSHWVFDGRREDSLAVIVDRLDISDAEKALVATSMRAFAD